jgi:hypothetical protein
MCSPRHLLLLIAVYFVLVGATASGASIMVNEYKNSNGNVSGSTKMVGDEFFEFVLTENWTAAQLAGLTFGDSNSDTSTLQGVFQFDLATLNGVLTSSGQSAFLAGTIIVVKGATLGSQNLSYSPTLSNVGNDDAWSIELVAGQGAKDHPETLINGNIDIAGQGDVIWVAQGAPTSATDTSGWIHAIGHDNKPGVIADAVVSQFGSGALLPASVGAPMNIFNTAGAVASVDNQNTGSMGAGNGGANTSYIQGLRSGSAVPEPGRCALLLLGMLTVLCTRQR